MRNHHHGTDHHCSTWWGRCSNCPLPLLCLSPGWRVRWQPFLCNPCGALDCSPLVYCKPTGKLVAPAAIDVFLSQPVVTQDHLTPQHGAPRNTHLRRVPSLLAAPYSACCTCVTGKIVLVRCVWATAVPSLFLRLCVRCTSVTSICGRFCSSPALHPPNDIFTSRYTTMGFVREGKACRGNAPGDRATGFRA